MVTYDSCSSSARATGLPFRNSGVATIGARQANAIAASISYGDTVVSLSSILSASDFCCAISWPSEHRWNILP
jgi:hypothetical protein